MNKITICNYEGNISNLVDYSNTLLFVIKKTRYFKILNISVCMLVLPSALHIIIIIYCPWILGSKPPYFQTQMGYISVYLSLSLLSCCSDLSTDQKFNFEVNSYFLFWHEISNLMNSSSAKKPNWKLQRHVQINLKYEGRQFKFHLNTYISTYIILLL